MKALKSLKLGCFPLSLVLLWATPPSEAAGPIVYQATGTREQIQPVVDQFKHDILYGIGGDGSSMVGAVHVATFDDVSTGSDRTVESIGEGRSNGILLPVPPGHRFSVSAGITDPSNPNRLFGDINPSYPTEFASFSSPSILALRDPGFEPGISRVFAGPLGLPTKAFGAVFVDVDSPTSAYVDVSSFELPERLRFDVPAAPGHGNFSFVGLLMEEGEVFPYGSIGVGVPLLRASGEDASYDMVAIDDITYGIVVPEPTAMQLGLLGGLLTWIAFAWRRKQPTAGNRNYPAKPLGHSGTGWLHLALLLTGMAWKTAAQPVIYQATGTREQIQPVLDQFKHDILYGVGGAEQPGQLPIGRFNVATFDDLSAGTATAQGFGVKVSGGIVVQGLGTNPTRSLLVSAGDGDPSNPNRLFGDIHSSYPTEFAAYSSPGVLAVRAVDLIFWLNEPSFNPLTAFGAVFVDVDLSSSASMNLGRPYEQGLELSVPVAPGHANFSFVGAILGSQEVGPNTVAIRIPSLDPRGEDGSRDMVVIDDVILGAVPEPSSLCLCLVAGIAAYGSHRLLQRRTS